MREYTESQLSIMSNEEIKNHFLEVRSFIIMNDQKKLSKKDLEIYFCYIIKEIQNRELKF